MIATFLSDALHPIHPWWIRCRRWCSVAQSYTILSLRIRGPIFKYQSFFFLGSFFEIWAFFFFCRLSVSTGLVAAMRSEQYGYLYPVVCWIEFKRFPIAQSNCLVKLKSLNSGNNSLTWRWVRSYTGCVVLTHCPTLDLHLLSTNIILWTPLDERVIESPAESQAALSSRRSLLSDWAQCGQMECCCLSAVR